MLGRSGLRESGTSVVLLTEEFGLIRARAEGLRKSGAKLAHALQTLSECEATLLRGKDGWRLSGAVLLTNHFALLDREARLRAGRIAGLMLRLVQGESADARLLELLSAFLAELPEREEEEQDALECRAALMLLQLLGLDDDRAGETMLESDPLDSEERRAIITRVNRGIAASGL